MRIRFNDQRSGGQRKMAELSYNLPGYGFAKCYVLGQAIDLLELLEEAGLVEKMKNTCQLGTMRYVYPGAHHTRYEYVFTQLLLISNVVSVDARYSVDFSQSSNLGEYESMGHKISGSSAMQCLAILSNAGHMYDTFTSSRILLRLLVESKENKTAFYQTYKRNLPKEVQARFDALLHSGNYYKLHLFNMLHILQGLSRSDRAKNTCEVCIKLLSQLIDPSLIKNESTARIFVLYKKIRKIAYLSVDMIYTPASFGANLNRMIYSIPTYVDSLFDESSVMNRSIQQLEDVIHHQIYDSSESILNNSRIIQEKYDDYKLKTDEISTIFQIRNLILEKNEYESLHCVSQPRILKALSQKTTLLLSRPTSEASYILAKEPSILEKLPLSRIAFGTNITQNMATIYSAFGLLSVENIQKDIQTIISKAIEFELYSKYEKISLVKAAIQSIYAYGEYFFNFTSPHNIPLDECVFIGQGCKKLAQTIRNKFSTDNIPDANELHEILSCASILETIQYTGTVMCFVGGIKASNYREAKKIDELDGLIYFPNREQSPFAYIVEAKNYNHGEHDAAKQLEDTKDYLSTALHTDIHPSAKSAYMEISYKTQN